MDRAHFVGEPVRLFLVRHGESEANAAGTLEGYADAALTARGRAQAAAIAERASAWGVRNGRLLTSPMQRARHTADAIGAVLALAPEQDTRLVAGEGRAKLNLNEAGDEVAAALVDAQSHGGDLIAVSHRFPLRAFLATLYGAQDAAAMIDRLGNGEAYEIARPGGAFARAVHHRLS